MENQNVSADSAQLKQLNRWLLLLVVFIAIWSIGVVFYVQKRTEKPESPNIPLVQVDLNSGKITNASHANIVPKPVAGVSPSKSVYRQKETYQLMDFVIINYFFVEGMVIEKDKNGETYTVLYKNYEGTLQKITVPRDFLIVPSEGTVVNPASLLSP